MKISIQVRYSDFDMMGHLNNSAYATYFEIARLHYLMKLFEDNSIKWTDVVASITIDYRRPILPLSKPIVEIYCSRIGNSSYDLNYLITEESDKKMVYAEGKTIQVCIDMDTQKPKKLEDYAIEVLEKELVTKK